MYKIGFIDDDDSLFEDYRVIFKREAIELVFIENCETKDDILRWILSNNIKCFLVDYKLTGKYSFNGTELVAYINTELPDLPCIILSSFCDDGIKENLVIQNLFIKRDRILDDSKELSVIFKQAVDVFDNRLERNIKEYNKLIKKKYDGTLNANEEERYLELYKILRAYNEVDDIPTILLKPQATEMMLNIISSLDKLLDKNE
jgi:hypothetical protein